MENHDEDSPQTSGGGEANISHFIPPVELKGSDPEKLRKLDTLIVYLEQLRRGLAGNTTDRPAGYEGPSRHVTNRIWPWYSAGAILGVVVVLLLLAARSCT